MKKYESHRTWVDNNPQFEKKYDAMFEEMLKMAHDNVPVGHTEPTAMLIMNIHTSALQIIRRICEDEHHVVDEVLKDITKKELGKWRKDNT